MRRALCDECDDELATCDHCGCCDECCDCDELFDADELGLDPEEDADRRYHA